MRRPDIAGDYGSGWKVPQERMARFASEHPEKVDPAQLLTTVGLWYVNGKQFHPFWQWWMISAISLADMPGYPPAHKEYALAEWEIAIYALNPLSKVPPLNGEGPCDPIMPSNLVVHFHGITREQTDSILRFVVEAVCAGRTTPDTEWRKQNRGAIVRLVNDYYVGRYGGKMRTHPLDIDPFTDRFTGEIATEIDAWAEA